MPVAQPPGPAHHHHHSSLFSSIGSFFHALQPSHHSSAVAPDASPSTSLSSSSSSSSHGSSSELYEAFEANLAQRISLLLPTDEASCVNLPSLKQGMDVLLSTHADLKSLFPSPGGPRSQTHIRMMEEFMDRSVKMLDICRVIKEQVEDVEGAKGLLEVVIGAMATVSSGKKGRLTRGQTRRARKALAELLFLMEGEKAGEGHSFHGDVQSHSFGHAQAGRSSSAAREEQHEPQRWMSWHGSSLRRRSSLSAGGGSSYLERQIAAIAASLSAPKLSAMDAEESFCAVVYSFNVVCIFFLSSVLSALPCPERNHVLCFNHPRTFLWTSPLTHLQEKVQEELKKRGMSGGYGGLWELDQIVSIVKRLAQLTDSILSCDEFPFSDPNEDELKNLVKRLKQHLEELELDLHPLHAKVSELYNRLMQTRSELLDVISQR